MKTFSVYKTIKIDVRFTMRIEDDEDEWEEATLIPDRWELDQVHEILSSEVTDIVRDR